MGQLRFFNIKRIISEFNIDCFFETGTWKGDGLAYAGKYPFKKLFSSEIIPELAQKAADRFKDDKRVTIINNNSLDALQDKINEISGNCLFWLDAHFPGAEEGVSDYNATSSEQLKYPLEAELKEIFSRRKGFSDFILIDDLRIYEDGNYESGNMPAHILPPINRNINFVIELAKDTHDIVRSYRHEGYLLLTPKNKQPLNPLKQMIASFLVKTRKKIY